MFALKKLLVYWMLRDKSKMANNINTSAYYRLIFFSWCSP